MKSNRKYVKQPRMKTIRKLSTIDKKRKQIIRGTLDDEAKENVFKAAEKE